MTIQTQGHTKTVLRGKYETTDFEIWMNEQEKYACYIPSTTLRTSFKNTIGEAVDRGIHYMGKTNSYFHFIGEYQGYVFRVHGKDQFRSEILRVKNVGTKQEQSLMTSLQQTIGNAVQRAVVNIRHL